MSDWDKVRVMKALHARPTASQRRGDLSSYGQCRRFRDAVKAGQEPVFLDAVTATLIYNLAPPAAWGTGTHKWTEAIQFFMSHASDDARHKAKIDTLLAIIGRGDKVVPVVKAEESKAQKIPETPEAPKVKVPKVTLAPVFRPWWWPIFRPKSRFNRRWHQPPSKKSNNTPRKGYPWF